MGRFHLPTYHEPFMVLEPGEKFSCSHCKFLYRHEGHNFCGSRNYEQYFGYNELVDPHTKQPIVDLNKACSDWFEPAH